MPNEIPEIFRAARPGDQTTRPRWLAVAAVAGELRRMKFHLLRNYLWQEWIRPFVLPLLCIMAAKSALADVNPVPTGSMIPTVLEGDVVFVNKLAYDLKMPFTTWRLAKWGDPARGDIVVCFSPKDGTRLLKRVVALPGDTIEMRNESLFINGVALTYAASVASNAGMADLSADERGTALFARETLGLRTHAMMVIPRRRALRNFGPIAVPAGGYFMLGDNRDNSEDSRFFGVVPRGQIVGEAKGVFVSADLKRWLTPRFARFFTALD